ncbi:class I SAM-dependent methyltransferase [Nonomuraea sp. MCN248]|uniref:Class I SAM-dependent methyltransferase n=1 Tax=Nonomuraea corallina TaxID=2989783 RepID=A0ABT4S471_9ACTN|nr:class I SAM-dependent methyltransferase [Nonomuraea corallina]MDA0632008.1 class I SAM-dependent methyltransferase [Nonomuraea corallina]
MPTLPAPGPEPHRERQAAESFGADPERYDRTRPRYPAPLVDRIVAAAPGPDVLDVGIGTGIAARRLRAAGCRVLGVEVDPRMAAFARRGGFDVEVSAFETWDPAGRTFDAVVSAQTWHWIDPAAGAAKAAGALRPGGLLAVFWNVAQPPPALSDAFAEVYARVLPHLPGLGAAMSAQDAYAPLFAKATDGMRATGALTEPEQWRFTWEQAYTRDEWLDQVPTIGGHSRFRPAELDALLAGVGAAIDAAGGGFTMAYTTVAVTATRA